MSASVLINSTVDGPKIRQALLPPTPVATPAVAGGGARVAIDVPGFTSGGVLMSGTSSGETGRVSLRSGGGKDVVSGRIDGSVVLGDPTNTGATKVSVIGASGTSTVYNKIYDPVIENFGSPHIGGITDIPGSYAFSPSITGMYCLSVRIIVSNATNIGNSVIQYYVEDNNSKSLIPTTTNTITPASLTTIADSGGASAPLVFNYLHFAYLTKFIPYNFVYSTPSASTQSLDIEVRWCQMC